MDGVIVMGGPMNVDQGDRYPWLEGEIGLVRAAHEGGVPVVGVCLGAQLIAVALGGKVGAMDKPEVGWGVVRLTFPGMTDPVFAGVGWETVQFHLHGQEVRELPGGGVSLAGSEGCRNQAFRVGGTTYGFQYHFEWGMDDLRAMARDPIVERGGKSEGEIIGEAGRYYEDYRRLGDRVSETLAMTLFSVGRR